MPRSRLLVLLGGGLALMAIPNAALRCQEVTFQNQAPVAGAENVQDLQFNLFLRTTVSQDGQLTESADETSDMRQRRAVQVLKVEENRATKVRVHYEAAQQTVTHGEKSGTFRLPVAGKTYQVARDDAGLTVTDEQGTTPPEDELSFVQRNMAAVGRTNPLGEFFQGKRLSKGDVVKLPAEVAASLLGLEDAVGARPAEFKLTLAGMRTLSEFECAEFDVSLRANSGVGDGLSMLVQGHLWIDPSTCRIIAAELSGPVGIFPNPAADDGEPVVTANGRLRVAVRSSPSSQATSPNGAGIPRTGPH